MSLEIRTHDFAAGILASLAIELKGSREFSKLHSGISILGYLTSVQDPINSQAFSQLLYFLGHRYPKIRKVAADQVYLVLLQNAKLVANDRIDQSLEILSETCWDGDIEEAKVQRLQLRQMAGLETRVLGKVNSSEPDKRGAGKRASADENESYAALVGSTGF
ncbi:tubulin-folding cofactor D-like [Aristolochia californica]|uniref:tubulin-folding cofactor D-like n=1 Tax=Aristolochia californica TaxID=171875 RepID=UPI0035D975BA